MAWDSEAFSRSLGGQSPATRRAYVGDLRDFVDWAERGAVEGPAAVDRMLLRRYLAFLTTRRYARATVARKAAALRCYFAWQRRRGVLDVDPARRLASPGGPSRLPRVLEHAELEVLLDGSSPEGGQPGPPAPSARPARTPWSRTTRWRRATTPCSSSSTGAGSAWPSCAASTSETSTCGAAWSR